MIAVLNDGDRVEQMAAVVEVGLILVLRYRVWYHVGMEITTAQEATMPTNREAELLAAAGFRSVAEARARGLNIGTLPTGAQLVCTIQVGLTEYDLRAGSLREAVDEAVSRYVAEGRESEAPPTPHLVAYGYGPTADADADA